MLGAVLPLMEDGDPACPNGVSKLAGVTSAQYKRSKETIKHTTRFVWNPEKANAPNVSAHASVVQINGEKQEGGRERNTEPSF
jgi:hypothetical protein